MEEANKQRSGRSLLTVSGAFLLVASLLVGAAHHRAKENALKPISSASVTDSLAQGVAWIWPDSNGPRGVSGATAPYREAAVMAESLVLRADRVERGGRRQPLLLPAGVRLIPVIHVETATDAPDELAPVHRDAIIAAVNRQATATTAGAELLQLDFEAPARQRETYRALVVAIREALPAGTRLSVTALAHWCTQGDWLDKLPVDEIVPMLYRLGPHADEWRRRFTQRDPALARRCQGPALGFATNDPPSQQLLSLATRPYWFDESSWSNPSRPPLHPPR
uniref:hypothetical protein n=1 Tax=Variovorax sp. BK018 TaxID=3450241 RepID=UPI004039A97A